MKLEEAIKLLQRDIDNPGSVDIMDVNQAEKLLIKAGKRELQWRKDNGCQNSDLLPGETKE